MSSNLLSNDQHPHLSALHRHVHTTSASNIYFSKSINFIANDLKSTYGSNRSISNVTRMQKLRSQVQPRESRKTRASLPKSLQRIA